MARHDNESSTVHGGGGSAQASDAFLRLGIQYATGNGVAHDLVAAHKWLNIAAIRGNCDALRYRREIAEEMTKTQLGKALKEARAWFNLR